MAEVDHGPAWYRAYRKFRGKKTREDYDKAVDLFFRYTLQIWVYGEDERITRVDGTEVDLTSRKHAMDLFCSDVCDGDRIEADRIFASVDSVTAYS